MQSAGQSLTNTSCSCRCAESCIEKTFSEDRQMQVSRIFPVPFWIGAEDEFCEQPFCYPVHDNLHKSTQPKHNRLKLNFIKSIYELQHGHMTSASPPLSFWHPSILKRGS